MPWLFSTISVSSCTSGAASSAPLHGVFPACLAAWGGVSPQETPPKQEKQAHAADENSHGTPQKKNFGTACACARAQSLSKTHHNLPVYIKRISKPTHSKRPTSRRSTGCLKRLLFILFKLYRYGTQKGILPQSNELGSLKAQTNHCSKAQNAQQPPSSLHERSHQLELST